MAPEQYDYAEVQTATKLRPLGQALVTLAIANREALLSEASNKVHLRQDEAAAVLGRLHQLNPAVARYFFPKSHAISELPLRMVCSSEPKFESVDSFIVISYSWHYPSWQLAPAAQPITPGWEISQPMVDAIMRLRKDEHEAVWLDRLCINQNDERDKEIHIGTMDLVYRSARRVIILFEDIQLTKEEGEAGVAYAGFYKDLCAQVTDQNLQGKERSDFINSYFLSKEAAYRDQDKGHLLQAIRSFLMKMLASHWSTRAWCAHESRVARHSTVNNPLILCFADCGRVLSFEFRFIFMLANIYGNRELVAADDFLNSMPNSLDPNPAGLQQLRLRMQRFFPYENENASLMEHLASVLQFGCLNKGDLISIVLNTSGIPLVFCGHHDVKTEEDAIWIFSVLTLAAGDAQPLLFEGDRLRFPNFDGTEAISWVSHPRPYFHGDKLCMPLEHSITAITRDYIELDLLMFPTPPVEPSPAAQEAALNMMEEHHLLDLAMNFTSSPGLDSSQERAIERHLRVQINMLRGHRTNLTRLTQLLGLWLACGIDNGLDWMIQFPDRIRQSTEAKQMPFEREALLGSSCDERLVDAVVSLLGYFGVHNTPTITTITTTTATPTATRAANTTTIAATPITIDSTSSEMRAIMSQLTKFLTSLLDPRHAQAQTRPTPARARPNPTQARQTPPSAPIRTPPQSQTARSLPTFSRSWIAVPAALAHLPAWQKRAWVVEPFDLHDASDDTGGGGG
ncbi:hypothetical protein NEMBOFW57_004060 [Staphylotrichum longicolle]|uniref:Heterokaryon incompatibility domain-containing protein n=1 Tax=Staphylotrichum longicolle TaxID=669026 RepID=A0AAD4F6G0_9PEZI|nr:hypothetical protein NEMBOFW57_004060 [Staphylotrichum longicolle]